MKASKFTVHQLLIPSSVECMVQSVIGRLAIARIEGGWPVVETWTRFVFTSKNAVDSFLNGDNIKSLFEISILSTAPVQLPIFSAKEYLCHTFWLRFVPFTDKVLFKICAG